MRHAAGIRSLRPPKPGVDPWQPIDVLVEEERAANGSIRKCVTVFLAGAECPFSCVHCDLWRFTLDGPTPVGAIPAQLERALASLNGRARPDVIKLYNASNFFDSRAVPMEDLPAIASLLAGFRQVTVECHPRLVGDACVRFAASFSVGSRLRWGLRRCIPMRFPNSTSG